MQAADNMILAGPDGSFGPVVARNKSHWVRMPVWSDVCHRGCAYTTVLQTVPGVYYIVLCAIKNTWSLSKKSIVSTLGFLLSWYCHDCAESDVIHCWQYSSGFRLILGLQHLDTVTTLAWWHCPQSKKYRQIKSHKTKVVGSILVDFNKSSLRAMRDPFRGSNKTNPANTTHLYNIYTMLGHRQRRWADLV